MGLQPTAQNHARVCNSHAVIKMRLSVPHDREVVDSDLSKKEACLHRIQVEPRWLRKEDLFCQLGSPSLN